MIGEGVIGDVWHVRSRRLSLGKLRAHENVWWSFAPHDVALMMAIVNAEPERVTASFRSGRAGGTDDIAYADFEFPNGQSAHIEVAWLDPEKSARLDVFGSHGVLTLAASGASSTLILRPFTISTDGRGNPVVTAGREQSITVEPSEPLREEVQAFIDAIAHGRRPETDAKQGLAVLRILSMAEKSARDRSQLEVTA
jgi:UDP-2-acetamido-3-amino-2,3-dideoxy-glucuronate N-acetyltransferase